MLARGVIMNTDDAKERENKVVLAYKTLTGLEFNDNNKVLLIKTLVNIGIGIEDLFNETDPVKLRSYLSRLIIQGHLGDIGSSEYIRICTTLLTYIEYLEHSKENNAQTIIIENRDKMVDSLTIAYYLSRFDKNALVKLGYPNFNYAFETIAHILGQKPATIKNMRDVFDPFFDNGRVGWYQRPLAGSRKEIFEKYANISFNDMTILVKNIMSAYSVPQDNTVKHRKIKINNNNMKEITSKRKKLS